MLPLLVLALVPSAAAFPPHAPMQRASVTCTSTLKEDITSWEDLRGIRNWTGLLPGDVVNGTPRACLHSSLRKEILKYGDLTQVTYDAFEAREHSLFFGQAYWNAKDLTGKLLTAASTNASRYECIEPDNGEPNCNYIYGHPDVYNSSKKYNPPKRWKDHSSFMEKYNLGIQGSKTYEGHWIGYIAVGPSGDGDPNGKDIVVAFRGTVMQQEWSVDFDFGLRDGRAKTSEEQKPEAGARPWIHGGFLRWYEDLAVKYDDRKITPQIRVQNRLKNLIEEQLPKKGLRCKSVTFVGHSLGGALAALAARDIALCRLRGKVRQYYMQKGLEHESNKTVNRINKDLWENISLAVFSYAAPRVGDLDFKKQLKNLNVSVINVVNFRDMVPVLPDARVLIQGLPWWVNIIPAGAALIARLLWWPPKVPVRRYDNENRLWLELVKRAGVPYVNSGYKLYFDTRKSECLRELRPSEVMINIQARHNLEVLLHMVATQHTSDVSPEEPRDVALMNKGGYFLHPYMAQELGIPVRWWSPIEHHHMAPMQNNGSGGVQWLWRDIGAGKAFTQVASAPRADENMLGLGDQGATPIDGSADGEGGSSS